MKHFRYTPSSHVSSFLKNFSYFRVSSPSDVMSKKISDLEYIVVAGGGGGGDLGGGGAGGYRSSVPWQVSGGNSTPENSFIIEPSVNYSIVVGAGGATNQNGFNTTLNNVISLGGGKGQIGNNPAGVGGSGGGGGYNGAGIAGQFAQGTPGQGFPGSNGNSAGNPTAGGGGGGAGQPGVTLTSNLPARQGGTGIPSTITGSKVFLGGGGGGGSSNGSSGGAGGLGGGGAGRSGQGSGGSGPTPGSPNTGGGGGGGTNLAPQGQSGVLLTPGATGGSGIIILKYLSSRSATFSAGVTQSTTVLDNFKISTITATSTTSETVTFS